jgi:hypothetical protein
MKRRCFTPTASSIDGLGTNPTVSILGRAQCNSALDTNPDADGFRWSAYYGAEEGAPFNEGEIKWGSAANLAQAKRDSWSEVCRFLTMLGYTDDEITKSISQPAGSLILDLEDDDE